jgi:hypothetical protein
MCYSPNCSGIRPPLAEAAQDEELSATLRGARNMAAVCMIPQQKRILEHPPAFFFSSDAVAEAFNPFRSSSGLPLLSPTANASRLEPVDIPEGWLCFYSFGLSIGELRLMFGCDGTRPPCFQGGAWDWWLQPRESRWVSQMGTPGYVLLSLDGFYGYSTWARQTEEIALRCDPTLRRPSERLLCEAFFVSWILNGWGESSDGFYWPWCKYFRHWGHSTASNGERVWVALSYEGAEIGSVDDNCSTDPYLGTALYRKL